MRWGLAGGLVLGVLCTGSAPARQVPLTVGYTAGLNAPLEKGALPRLVARLKQLREEERNVILLDGGDWRSGSALAALSPDLMPACMAAMAPDAMLPGVAEISDGYRFIQGVGKAFPWVVGNWIPPADFHPRLPGYRIVEVDGIRVLIAGLTCDQPALWCLPGTMPGVRTETAHESLKRLIPEIRAASAEVRILMAQHSAAPGGTLTELAKAFPDFDLYLGAASEKTIRPQQGQKLLLASPEPDARSYVVASLLYDTVRRDIIRSDVTIEPVRDFYDAESETAERIFAAQKKFEKILSAETGLASLNDLAEALRTKLKLDICLLAPKRPGKCTTWRDVHACQAIDEEFAILQIPAGVLRDIWVEHEGHLLVAGAGLVKKGGVTLRLADGTVPIAKKRLNVAVPVSVVSSAGGRFRAFRDLALDPGSRLEGTPSLYKILNSGKGK